MSDREYIVTVPVRGYATYVTTAHSASEAKAKADNQCAGENDAIEVTWIGKATEARETDQSKRDRGAL